MPGGGDYAEGTRVAFHDKELSWTLGKISRVEQKEKKQLYHCTADDVPGQSFMVDNKAKLYLAREELFEETPDDLLMLTELHEATLLNCLKKRFLDDVVYTNIGTLIVALNPFKRIPVYQPEVSQAKYLANGPVVLNALPHVWSVAHQTYYELIYDRRNQTILISGESGAGKTVAAKIVVDYLTAVSCQNATAAVKEATEQVGTRVQAASPVLESFGNAKTVRNDNSSRFGKFMKIQFDKEGFLVGAHTTKYLLEKSRIITASKNERVYHIFYQLCAHADHGKYALENDRSLYKSCNAGECLEIDGVNDAEDQQACIDAMSNIGLTEEEKSSVWKTVAGILHLQNADVSEKTVNNNPVAFVEGRNKEQLVEGCKQWGVDAVAFERELTSTTSQVGSNKITKQLPRSKAMDVRDSVCKRLYDSLFQWLVDDKINVTTSASECTNWLGLLDIFGFECFEYNSFEQLCINLANETLQNHYNNYIFTEDLKECQREGIDMTEVKFDDNQACLDLLSGKNSVMAALDVECALPKGGDEDLLHKLDDAFGTKQGKGPQHEYYGQARGEVKRNNPNSFIIRHYAGDVIYTVQGWLEKNKEPLKDEVKLICRNSTDQLLKTLLPPPPDSSRPAATVTVSASFVNNVKDLLLLINSTNPHWIRCIKPHPAKKPLMWDPKSVMNQLRSAGVMDTVRVRKAGYPIRIPHALFRERYAALHGKEGLKSTNTNDPEENLDLCRKILQRFNITKEAGQIGKTKIFLRQQSFVLLNREKDEAIAKLIQVIQSAGRGQKTRHTVFMLYVEKHKARLEAEGKERVEAERRAREQAAAQEKAEAAERAVREESMRQARGESMAVLQRVGRGYFARTTAIEAVLRALVEEQRARQEAAHDGLLYTEHLRLLEVGSDQQRFEDAEARFALRYKPVSARSLEIEMRAAERKAKDDKKRAYEAALSDTRRERERRVREEEEARRQRARMRDAAESKIVLTTEVERRARLKFLKSMEEKERAAAAAPPAEERAAHFARACRRFEARDDWEHNREAYLARDRVLQRQQERSMRDKQYLMDNDLFHNPPNPQFVPDMAEENLGRSSLTSHQRHLEAAYQERIQREYSLLRSLGRDPIDELKREREEQLKGMKERRCGPVQQKRAQRKKKQ